MIACGTHGAYNLNTVRPKYDAPIFDDETFESLRGGLYAWEVQEYAKATGQTMEQAMQDDGTVLFAAVPRQSRGAVISLLELVAKPIDS